VRAKAGKIIGALVQLLIVMKGLPLAYAKDMQEDKDGTIRALSDFSVVIAATAGMTRDLVADEKKMKAAAGEGYSTATDLADWLVQKLNIPFREAHHITGTIVAKASAANVPLHRLPLVEMQQVEKRITDDVFSVLSVAKSVASRTSYGGTAPKNVRIQAKRWLKKLGKAG
jgi:argininosuccinate lyase